MKKASDIAKVTTKSKAASKLAKAGPGAIVAAASVALDYRKDTKAGLTKSKRMTNLAVNGGFAIVGVALICIPGVNAVVIGFISAGLIIAEVALKDNIQKALNSLD